MMSGIRAILRNSMKEKLARDEVVASMTVRLARSIEIAQIAQTAGFDTLEQSCLKEAGNILSGAYMNALSDFMGMLLLPSVPSLVVDLSAAVLTTTYLNFGHERDFVFCVETEFHIDSGEGLRGDFLLLPDLASLKAIFDAIRLT